MTKKSKRNASLARRRAQKARGQQRGIRNQRLVMGALTISLAVGIGGSPALGDGVGVVLNSKSLPEATIAVIDPESGTSSGGSGSDVRIAVGDVILFRFAFAAVPDKALHGQMAYLTEYVPAGTDVVGVRILDENGETIEPFFPGQARDGCHSQSNCNYGSSEPVDCSAGSCVLDEGSMAQLVADTGVFFSVDARTDHNPNDEFLTTNNGIDMTGFFPLNITNINGLIGDDSGPFFAHNLWDFIQVRAFGQNGGNTPHLYGSPVAGPNTHYGFEVTDVSGSFDLEFNGVEGPWERIAYPGSLTGTGNGNADGDFGASTLGRVGVDTAVGWDVTPAPADGGARTGRIEGANAVRFAVGEARTGVQMFAEIALRVNSVPIAPDFADPLLPGGGGNIDCAEVFGSDLSGDFPQDNRGQDNSWAAYMGSPTCVFLRNKFDLTVDQPLYSQAGNLHYTLDGSNLSLTAETNANACIKYDGSAFSFVSATASPSPASETCTAAACGDTSTLSSCLIYPLGTLAPGADYAIEVDFLPQGVNGKDAVTTQAVYSSDQLPINTGTLLGGFQTQALSIVTAVPIPEVDLAGDWDPLTTFAPENTTQTITGTLQNVGTADFKPQDFYVHLPTGWSLASSGGAATEDVTVNGVVLECDVGCGTEDTILGFDGGALDVTAGGSQTVSFDVIIPSGETTGLYNIDVGINFSATGFGATSQSYFHDAVIVNVGAPRSTPPVLTCPIGSTNPSIDGTTVEADTTVIRAKFNLIERGDAAATSGAFSVTNFGAFGGMYGGLEIKATAQAPGELESELSAACEVTAQRECSDGFDNDGDGFTDFPADIGCESATDGDETNDPAPECADGIDNDGDGVADFAGTLAGATDPNLLADNGCSGPRDAVEGGEPECNDTVDNDADGLVDTADPDCDDASDATELGLAECQNYIDDDGDGLIDFAGLDVDDSGTVDINADPGCTSAFDDDETNDPVSTDIKARLLVVMDTSGSMNFNTCNSTFTGGDGSTECPGDDVTTAVCDSDTDSNGLPDDSRMSKVKSGISDVIAGYGEVEYGLMRYAQRDEEFQCPTVLAAQRSGGWQGGGAPPCDGGFNEGELLVSFSGENQSEILAYMDGESNYNGFDPEIVPAGMDRELRGSGTTPIGGSLSSANDYLTNESAIDPVGACRPYAVVLVTDGGETCDGDPVARAADLLADGFEVYVIGFATNDQTIIDGLDAIAAAGGTGTAIVVDDAATLSQAMADIVTDTILVERCNGADDDCDCPGDTNGDSIVCGPGDVGVDEDFPNLGDTCDNGQNTQCFREGEFVCAADELGTECNAPTVTPGTEVCNGLDDNCNLVIDEGFAEPCICVPTLEICNGVDDDCDDAIDEDSIAEPLPGVGDGCGFDVGICTSGVLACTAGNFDCVGGTDPELEDDILNDCDGLDNDCDTVVDEVTEICFDPDDNIATVDAGCDVTSGVCQGLCQTGLRSCTPASPFGPDVCQNDIGPAIEICNGLDDDCDGIDDNGFPVGDTCDNGQLGECLVVGELICDVADSEGDGDFVQCTAFPVAPGVEICNGLDDDCDGLVDENPPADPLPAPVGNSCGGTGTACDAGTIVCVDGALECDGVVGGSDETCNGIDDDCDSLVDEDTAMQPLLGIGDQCYPFASGCDLGTGLCEGTCDFGATICVAGGVVCDGGVGPATEETCNGADDNCDGEIDEAAECPLGTDVCFEGACVSPCGAGEFPCPLDFFCQNVPGEGDFCTEDPCVALDCEDSELCDSDLGACYDPCDTTDCPTGTQCLLGGCFDCFDPGFECPEGENCVIGENVGIGECTPDLCFFTECQDDQFCREGACVDITCDPACGDGEQCEEGTCVANLCEGVECGTRICDPTSGECVEDACASQFCPQGTACNPGTGECIGDPCLELTCPSPLVCEIGFGGNGQCVEAEVDAPEGDWVSPGGGGGCSSSGSSGSGLGGFMLLGLIGLVRRRRQGVAVPGR